MNQIFPYLGSKKRIAPKYPAPGGVVVEPFAGAAGYSVYWEPEKVILFDVFEPVVRVWDFVINAGKHNGDPIRDLPLLNPGDDVPDIEGSELIGFWCVRGVESPRRSLPDGGWVKKYPTRFWGEYQRERLASDSVKCRNWEMHHADFFECPDIDATWFIDPPYSSRGGKFYKHKFTRYAELADFAKTRRGQVIVCEEMQDNLCPDWLPFEPFLNHVTTNKRAATECIWTQNVISKLL